MLELKANIDFNLLIIIFYLCSGNDLPGGYLRLLAPPLQLLSAAVWQVVQQGLVDHYGMLEEFVTMVTELVPELMSYSQRAQLILGLRARVSAVYSVGKIALILMADVFFSFTFINKHRWFGLIIIWTGFSEAFWE